MLTTKLFQIMYVLQIKGSIYVYPLSGSVIRKPHENLFVVYFMVLLSFGGWRALH